MRLLDRAGNRQKLLSAGARFAVAVLCVSSIAQRVLAQPVAAPRLQYEATGACPSQAEFLTRMQARMDADGTRAPGDISLRVMLSAQAAGTHGTIEIRRGATNTRRVLDGGRCEEVAEALALIAALAVREADPARDPRPRTRARKPDKTTPLPEPTSTTSNEATTTRSEPKRAARASESTRAPDNSVTEAAGSTSRRDGSATNEPSRSATRDGADPSRSAAKPAAGVSEADSSSHSGDSRDGPPSPGRAGRGVATARGDARSADGQRDASDAAERRSQSEALRDRDSPGGPRVGAQEQVADRSSPQGSDNRQDSRRGGPSSERSTIQRNGGADEQRTGASAAADAAAESGSDAKAARSQELASNASWRVGASAMLFSGLAPELQPALQLQAAVTLNAGALVWSLQLGARIARSTALTSPDGDARFGFAGGIVRLCAAHALGSTPLTFTGCAAAEPGVFSAKGENTRNQRTYSRLWLAAGAAADLSVQLASWLSLRAGAELLAPLRRDRIVLAGDTLYRVPALGFRWHLGLEVPFG